jgi:hypothetical protein
MPRVRKAKPAAPPARPARHGLTREEVAYHEAGHAVVSYLLGEPIVRVIIKQRHRGDGRESYGYVQYDGLVPALVHAISSWAGPLAVEYYLDLDPDLIPDFDLGRGIPVLYGFPEVSGGAGRWFLHDLALAGQARRRRGRTQPDWPWRVSQRTHRLLYEALAKLGRRLAIDLMRTRKVQAAIGVVARRLLEVEELDGREVARLLAPRLKPLFRWPRPDNNTGRPARRSP